MQRSRILVSMFVVAGCLAQLFQVNAQPLERTNKKPRDIFVKSLAGKEPREYITNIGQWRAAHKRSIEDAMAALPAGSKAKFTLEADKAIKYTWPALPASQFLEYKQTGNRTNYQRSLAERRAQLSRLLVGELINRKGKYLPQIANGLWATLEESTWVLPAHVVLQKSGIGLPDPAETIVDLTSGETSVLIAWSHLLLHDELAKLSPMLTKRMLFELERRTVVPYLEKDFWWMGFGNRLVNNWNIWINTNVLLTALLTVNDNATLNKLVAKTMRSSDQFVNYYGDDGGCDEGPSYWGHAGGKLIEFVELLQQASENRLDYKGEQLFKRIGEYIYKVHIAGDRFVNFADASARLIPPPSDVYSYGEIYDDAAMKGFASYLYRIKYKDSDEIAANEFFSQFVRDIRVRDRLLNMPAKVPYSRESWMPDLQVLTARTGETDRGLFTAIQGGHNGESHNHNDVGNFIVYVDSQPAIIDAGVATYTRQTFGGRRYELWHTQSNWHNCPMINGVAQKDGNEFRARNVSFNSEGPVSFLSMDIAAAYPAEAAVEKWQRVFTFDRSNRSLTLREDYKLREWKQPQALSFITAVSLREIRQGVLQLDGTEGGGALTIEFDPNIFDWNQETKVLDDNRLSRVWGKQIFRIILTDKRKELTGEHTIRFISHNSNQ